MHTVHFLCSSENTQQGSQAGISSHSAGSTSRLAQQEILEASIPCLHQSFGHCCSQGDHTDFSNSGRCVMTLVVQMWDRGKGEHVKEVEGGEWQVLEALCSSGLRFLWGNAEGPPQWYFFGATVSRQMTSGELADFLQ